MKQSYKNKYEYWSKQVNKWKVSQNNQVKFCDQHGLNYNSFVYWRMQILENERGNSKKKLAPVKVPTSIPAPTSSPCSVIRIKLKSGALVELPMELPEAKLKSLINLFGVTSC